MSICAKAGCPAIATDHGRCKQHRKLVTGTGSRGSTRKWRALRLKVLERDGYRCTFTLDGNRCSITTHLQAHHLIAVRDGGLDEMANLETRCPPHH